VHGQAPAPPAARPAFEVASVKPNRNGDGRVALAFQPGGRVTASNVGLRDLIRLAYQVQPFQIVGGPSWMDSERFDVAAKAPGDVPLTPIAPGGPPGTLQLMMQSLLAERFNLVAKSETREMPIYNLVLARADGKPGDKLQRASVDCATLGPRRGGPPPAPPDPSQRPMCGMRIGPGLLSAGGMTLLQFANAISPMLQRIVVDKTGLTGAFDFDLQWTPDAPQGGLAAGPAGAPPGANAPPPFDPNGPTLSTALQEQLGLKLESARGAVPVLVIDAVEMPTPD
jgi:uncharacterized protein (TIGR03435 family)